MLVRVFKLKVCSLLRHFGCSFLLTYYVFHVCFVFLGAKKSTEGKVRRAKYIPYHRRDRVDWTCVACSFLNPAQFMNCEICATEDKGHSNHGAEPAGWHLFDDIEDSPECPAVKRPKLPLTRGKRKKPLLVLDAEPSDDELATAITCDMCEGDFFIDELYPDGNFTVPAGQWNCPGCSKKRKVPKPVVQPTRVSSRKSIVDKLNIASTSVRAYSAPFKDGCLTKPVRRSPTLTLNVGSFSSDDESSLHDGASRSPPVLSRAAQRVVSSSSDDETVFSEPSVLFVVPEFLPVINSDYDDELYIADSSANDADGGDLRCGTFSRTLISKNASTPIVFWRGRIVDEACLKRLEAKQGSGYFIALDPPYIKNGRRLYANSAYIAQSGQCKASMVNCSQGATFKNDGSRVIPNCALRYVDGHPVLVAIRDIFPGDELFWDYGRTSRDLIDYPWSNYLMIPVKFVLAKHDVFDDTAASSPTPSVVSTPSSSSSVTLLDTHLEESGPSDESTASLPSVPIQVPGLAALANASAALAFEEA